MVQQSFMKQCLITIIVNLSSLNYGLLIGWPSPTQEYLQSKEHPAVGDEPFSDTMISWVSSLVYVGAFIGTCFWAKVMDKVGRKIGSILIVLPYVVSWFIITFTRNTMLLYMARLLGGIGNAGSAMNCPMYVAETCKKEVRDRLGTFFSSFISIGVLLAYVSGSILSYENLSYFNLIFSGISLFLTCYLPESPIFYIKNNEANRAKRSLIGLRNYDETNEEDMQALEEEMKLLKSSFLNHHRPSTFKDILIPSTRNAILVGCGVVLSRHISGATIIISSAVYLFQQAAQDADSPISPNEMLSTSNITDHFLNTTKHAVLPISHNQTLSTGNITDHFLNKTLNLNPETSTTISPQVASIILGILQLVAGYASFFLVNKGARKTLLTLSTLILGMCMFSQGVFYYLKFTNYPNLSALTLLPIISLSIYILMYDSLASPLSFVILSELFPAETRNKCMGYVMMFQFIVIFAVIKSFPIIKDLFYMHGAIWVYAIGTFVCVAVVDCFLPETKDRPFKDIVSQLTFKKSSETPLKL